MKSSLKSSKSNNATINQESRVELNTITVDEECACIYQTCDKEAGNTGSYIYSNEEIVLATKETDNYDISNTTEDCGIYQNYGLRNVNEGASIADISSSKSTRGNMSKKGDRFDAHAEDLDPISSLYAIPNKGRSNSSFAVRDDILEGFDDLYSTSTKNQTHQFDAPAEDLDPRSSLYAIPNKGRDSSLFAVRDDILEGFDDLYSTSTNSQTQQYGNQEFYKADCGDHDLYAVPDKRGKGKEIRHVAVNRKCVKSQGSQPHESEVLYAIPDKSRVNE